MGRRGLEWEAETDTDGSGDNAQTQNWIWDTKTIAIDRTLWKSMRGRDMDAKIWLGAEIASGRSILYGLPDRCTDRNYL